MYIEDLPFSFKNFTCCGIDYGSFRIISDRTILCQVI